MAVSACLLQVLQHQQLVLEVVQQLSRFVMLLLL
jgi:hypothetical protein